MICSRHHELVHSLGRLAPGATGPGVAALVVRETMTIIGIGAMVGWILAFGVVRQMPGGRVELAILAGVPVLLLAVAVLACWIPARRAGRLDPIEALRVE